MKAFEKFENTTDALSAVTGIVEGKMPKNLKKFLQSEIKDMNKEQLIISDPKLGMNQKDVTSCMNINHIMNSFFC